MKKTILALTIMLVVLSAFFGWQLSEQQRRIVAASEMLGYMYEHDEDWYIDALMDTEAYQVFVGNEQHIGGGNHY